MTTSKIADAEDLTAYERWELPLVEGSGSSIATAKELESIQKQAYQEGFASGQKEGKADILKSVQSLRSILDVLAEPLKELDDDIVNQLAELSMLVAKQVVRRELHTEAGEIVGIVREAISALPASSRQVVLHIHPDDAEIVRNVFSLDQSTESEELRWKLVEDPMLTRGGCKITSEFSTIDATVEGRLNRVINTLLGGERETDE